MLKKNPVLGGFTGPVPSSFDLGEGDFYEGGGGRREMSTFSGTSFRRGGGALHMLIQNVRGRIL